MTICPFCKSVVNDDATVCPNCNAEKETTFQGHFKRAVEKIKPTLGLTGMFGLLVGFACGMYIGIQTFALVGFIVGFVVFFFVMFLPAIIRALFKINNVVWYR